MNRKKSIFIILTTIVIISGVVISNNFGNKIGYKDTSNEELDLGIPIELSTAKKDDIVENLSYVGTIAPKKSAIVSPTAGGKIEKIYVEEGSEVKPGDTLAKIEDTALSASLNTSSKKLETLKTNYNYLSEKVESFHKSNPTVKKIETLTSNYEYLKKESEKYLELYNEGAVSKSAYEKIKHEADAAYLQLEELKATIDDSYNTLIHEKNMVEKQLEEVRSSINELNIKIEDTLIKAPIQGVVKVLHYEEGELAVAGKPLANIDDNRELLVNINVTENDINKIDVGSKVILKSDEMEEEVISEVSKIIPNINPNTRIGELEIGPIDFGEEINLVSGNSIDVSIVTNEAIDKITIPKSAIKNLNEKNIVYLYEDEAVKEVNITTGLTVGENVEVLEGLQEGDKIAIKNLSKLYNNAKAYVFKGVDK